MRTTWHLPTVGILGSLLALAACSSSGGGSPPAPTIVSAAFVGAGSTPVAGDSLLLTLSRPIALIAGRTLDDSDFALSDGTLGTITVDPVVATTQTVRITLGAGVTLSPNSTTIAFSPDNDALQSADGALGFGGTPRTITDGDGDAPMISNVTLNGIEDALNGEGAAGGTLQVPRNGFRIHISHSDISNTIDVNKTFITGDRPILVAGATRAAGDNLVDALTLVSTSTTETIYNVPTNVEFGDSPHALTVIVGDSTGMSSGPTTYAFTVRGLDDGARPFERTQTWFLDLSRDIEDIAPNLGLTVTSGADGTADFDELLLAIGLHGASSTTNATVTGILQTRILSELATLFSEVSVSFTFTSPGTFPDQATIPFGAGSFSQICIAGSATGGASEILGSALFDLNNASQENNCLEDFGENNSRLGVFPHAALRIGIATGPSSLFRMTFDPFTPIHGGTAIGATGDDARLAEVSAGTNVGADSRIDEMAAAIQAMARLVAVVTAHECGHSMGLVANGPMPNGLYGGDRVNFPLTGGLTPAEQEQAANGHIQNTALFPGGAQNVMSPAINFDAAQSAATLFNSLNKAYLQERAIYVPN